MKLRLWRTPEKRVYQGKAQGRLEPLADTNFETLARVWRAPGEGLQIRKFSPWRGSARPWRAPDEGLESREEVRNMG
jgi:hypothetical protein